MAWIEERAGKDKHVALGSRGKLPDIRLDLAPDLAVVGRVLRHHVRQRKGLGHCLGVRCIGCRGLMATVHGRVLAAVVAQLGAPTLGNAWIRVELVGALFPFGILQQGRIQAFDHHQRGLAGLRVQHREVVGTQRQGFHRCGHCGRVDRFRCREQVSAAVKRSLFLFA
ncbi:hypothetical protein D3C75_806440 [compost metagenome]